MPDNKLKIVLFGMSGVYSRQTLQTLINNSNIIISCFVTTSNEKYTGKDLKNIVLRLIWQVKKKLYSRFLSDDYLTVDEICFKYHIPVYRPQKFNSIECYEFLQEKEADLFCVTTFNRIFKAKHLAIPKKGTINMHPSLLPKYRGSNPAFWMYKNNEPIGGVTIHFMDEGIDTGSIIMQETISLDDLTPNDYLIQCAKVAAKLINKVIDSILNDRVVTFNQTEEESTYYSKPTEQDGEITILQNNLKRTYFNILGMMRDIPVFIKIADGKFRITKVVYAPKVYNEYIDYKKMVIANANESLILKGYKTS